jgi:NAD(P)-dependent dehydrogenase (short-subunit alcohol dehydrogenase family)
MSQLEGAVAVVTGAGSGLGKAMTRAFAAEGMRIAALDINGEHATATADALRKTGTEAIALAVDVANRKEVESAAAAVEDMFGACNVLCSNVGVQQFGMLDTMTDEDWQWFLSVNVLGTIHTIDSFLPLMRRSENRRHIVFTSSVAALAPSVRQGAYIVTKYAVTGYADVLRIELADEGIHVTTLFPSGMITSHLQSSEAARPAELGAWSMRDEDLQAVIATAGGDESEVTTPDDAIRHLVGDMLSGEPYVITHGSRGHEIRARHAAIEGAFARMRAARGG